LTSPTEAAFEVLSSAAFFNSGVFMIIFLSAVFLIFLIYTLIGFSCLKDRISDLENEVSYQKQLPIIAEYIEFKNGHDFYRDGDFVGYYAGINPFPNHVKLDEVSRKHKELKSVLEKNCPKKCEKKRRGKS
jgi:hypothetical protein